MMRNKTILLAGLCLLACARDGFALGQTQYVETVPAKSSFPIVQKNSTAKLFVDSNDFPGVLIAAGNLQKDISRVTRRTPEIVHDWKNSGINVILVGSAGKSEIIDRLVREKKIDISPIAGKWESFFLQVVPRPLPGIQNALVICGSDQRGTIYGIYDLSEQIGVSPWYFWADVPPKHHSQLFVKAGTFIQGPPAVKYRGIFINDEAPDLTGWVREKYGDVPGHPGVANYGHGFYTNIFELLLRLKANYLWPAMWDNCFNADDPLNPKLANEYGIVMGTSHVEPMMRADKEWSRAGNTAKEWNYATHPTLLSNFWREGIARNDHYESIITVGMRGKTDSAMAGVGNLAGNIGLLERIVADQRSVIADVLHTNAADVPQDWAIYKEVQNYYDHGARVPGDVTLLWSDDNWGNLRRVPAPNELNRAGGAGIYYHLEYVGVPRNYKWVNTVQIERVWEQMNLAHRYGANQIWIANVGHLLHVTFPAEFFLSFAWDPTNWPKGKIPEFYRLWAGREFGKKFAPQIARIVAEYTKFNARRKPELLSPGTFSVVNYGEADRVLADWKAITSQAEDVYQQLPADERDAFFELVLYPVKACEIVNELYIDAAKNRLYAAQGRASANDYAADVKGLFQADAGLSAYYNHTLAGGRWNHMMDQTHIGYTRWQQPESNVMPHVVEIPLPDKAEMGVAVEGSTNAWPEFSGEAVLPPFDEFNQSSRYVDVFDKGKLPFEFSVNASAPWILLDATNGTVEKEKRLQISVDWQKVPIGSTNGFVKITSRTNSVFVRVNVFNPLSPSRRSVKGFVEADGYVSMEAAHFTKNVASKTARWENISNLGRTHSAMTLFPVVAPSVTPPENSPCLEYKMFLFDAGKVSVETILSPTLNFVPGRGLRFALSFDDRPPRVVTAVPVNYSAGNGNRDWERTVADSVRKISTDFDLPNPGEHTLKVWMVDPGVVLQKIVVNCGGVKLSYLGPPESFHR
jgi:Glycosyl hydrolase family 115/Gylcosyl hydrolase family 115 C-terminal domain